MSKTTKTRAKSQPKHQCLKCGSYHTKKHGTSKNGVQRIYCYDCGKTSRLEYTGNPGRPRRLPKSLYSSSLSAVKGGKSNALPFACWAATPDAAKAIAKIQAQIVFPAEDGWKSHTWKVSDITHMTVSDDKVFVNPEDIVFFPDGLSDFWLELVICNYERRSVCFFIN